MLMLTSAGNLSCVPLTGAWFVSVVTVAPEWFHLSRLVHNLCYCCLLFFLLDIPSVCADILLKAQKAVVQWH